MRESKNIVQKAMANDELIKLLKGEEGYSIENDSQASISVPIDWTIVLPLIYKEYVATGDKSIKDKYFKAIEELLKGGAEDVYCGISVLYIQILREESNRAPFSINRINFIQLAKDGIEKNEGQLKQIKKWGGTNAPEGLLSEIKIYQKLLKSKYDIIL